MTLARTAIAATAMLALLGAGSVFAQSRVTQQELLGELQNLSGHATVLDIDQMRRDVTVAISNENSEEVVDRTRYLDYFANLPNFDVEILFDFDSDVIKPESFRVLGTMADALHHPVLRGDKFLIVGHTDAKGTRDYNLGLSQRRADAVREALVTTFRIPPQQVGAFGLGEEQLKDPANPEGAVNRRVQLLNLGPMPR